MTLRRVYQSWSVLQGEIKFEELFILHAIRTTAPEVYGFLLENRNKVIPETEQLMATTATKAGISNNSILDEWQQFINNLSSSEKTINWLSNQSYVKELIVFLFDKPPSHTNQIIPQRINKYLNPFTSNIDYWNRIHREVAIEEYSDQELLKVLKDWVVSNNEKLSISNKDLDTLVKFTDLDYNYIDKFVRPILPTQDNYYTLLKIVLNKIEKISERSDTDEVAFIYKNLVIGFSVSFISRNRMTDQDNSFFKAIFKQLLNMNIHLAFRFVDNQAYRINDIQSIMNEVISKWEEDPLKLHQILTKDAVSLDGIITYAIPPSDVDEGVEPQIANCFLLSQKLIRILVKIHGHDVVVGYQLISILNRCSTISNISIHKTLNRLIAKDQEKELIKIDKVIAPIIKAVEWQNNNNEKSKLTTEFGKNAENIDINMLKN